MTKTNQHRRYALLALVCSLSTSVVGASEPVVVATIDGAPITDAQFELAVYSIGRSSMYHGRPREDQQYLEFRRNVLSQLVERSLLLQEARRRGLQPDSEETEKTLADYEARYSSTERWQREGEQMLASLRQRFEEDDLLSQLEQIVRQVDVPTERQLRAFYDANTETFTEPRRDRVSVILLSVRPSAGADVWEAAREEARAILRRIDNGASFSEMARMHSADRTAQVGGDMGYLHDGMLSPAAQTEVDRLQPGDVSDVVTVLEGIVLFQLVERQQSRQRAFDDVRDRAAGLWARDRADAQWIDLLSRLHEAADIQVNEEYLASVPVAR